VDRFVRNLFMTATTYTKDYDGEFPHQGQLAFVNVTDGNNQIAISRRLLEVMMHDVGRDINTPHMIQGCLQSDGREVTQLKAAIREMLPIVRAVAGEGPLADPRWNLKAFAEDALAIHFANVSDHRCSPE
jgi:hypothetical protein